MTESKKAEEREKDRKTQVTLTIIATASSLLSVILVALVTYNSSIRVASIQADTQVKMQDVQIRNEQRKLESDQRDQKQKFISENLPKLFSPNEVDRKITSSMFLIFYPDDAKSIFDSTAISSTGTQKTEYQNASREAASYNQQLGSWIIVAGGYQNFGDAKNAVDQATKLGIGSVTVYKKGNSYRLTIGSFPSREEAERANIAVRAKLLDTAYVVNLGSWCPKHTESQEGNNILECVDS